MGYAMRPFDGLTLVVQKGLRLTCDRAPSLHTNSCESVERVAANVAPIVGSIV